MESTNLHKTPKIETLQRPKDERQYSLLDSMLVLTPRVEDIHGNIASGEPRVVNRLGHLTAEEEERLQRAVEILFGD